MNSSVKEVSLCNRMSLVWYTQLIYIWQLVRCTHDRLQEQLCYSEPTG